MDKKRIRKHDEFGPDSAGQAGDTQQLPDLADADSESVEELVEEGNAFEAEAVQGVEEAEDADVAEVTTREVPEDDVPEEYLNDEGKKVA
jgi:N utilization substance protein A